MCFQVHWRWSTVSVLSSVEFPAKESAEPARSRRRMARAQRRSADSYRITGPDQHLLGTFHSSVIHCDVTAQVCQQCPSVARNTSTNQLPVALLNMQVVYRCRLGLNTDRMCCNRLDNNKSTSNNSYV